MRAAVVHAAAGVRQAHARRPGGDAAGLPPGGCGGVPGLRGQAAGAGGVDSGVTSTVNEPRTFCSTAQKTCNSRTRRGAWLPSGRNGISWGTSCAVRTPTKGGPRASISIPRPATARPPASPRLVLVPGVLHLTSPPGAQPRAKPGEQGAEPVHTFPL